MKRTIALIVALLVIDLLSGCKKLSTPNVAETPVETASPSVDNLRAASSPMPSADEEAHVDGSDKPRTMTLDDVRTIAQDFGQNLVPDDFADFSGEYSSDGNGKYWSYPIEGGKWELEVHVNYVDGDELVTGCVLIPIGFEFCPQRYINIDKDDVSSCIDYVEAYDGTQTQLSDSEEEAARAAALDYYVERYSDEVVLLTRITDVTKFEGAVIFERIKGKLAAFYSNEYQSRSIVLTQTDNGEWEVINEGY